LKSWFLVVISGVTLLGCASVPLGEPEQDAALKKSAVAPYRAALFIYRDGIFDAAVELDVQVEGTPLGQTAVVTYL